MVDLKKVGENIVTGEYPRERIVTLTDVEMKKRAEKEDDLSNIIEERPEPEKKKPGRPPKAK